MYWHRDCGPMQWGGFAVIGWPGPGSLTNREEDARMPGRSGRRTKEKFFRGVRSKVDSWSVSHDV